MGATISRIARRVSLARGVQCATMRDIIRGPLDIGDPFLQLPKVTISFAVCFLTVSFRLQSMP